MGKKLIFRKKECKVLVAVAEKKIDTELEPLTCMASAREIVQKMMREKGLTSQQVKESFKEILNEKKS